MNGSAEAIVTLSASSSGRGAGAVLGPATWVDADLIVTGARKASFWQTYIREGFTPAVLAETGVQFDRLLTGLANTGSQSSQPVDCLEDIRLLGDHQGGLNSCHQVARNGCHKT